MSFSFLRRKTRVVPAALLIVAALTVAAILLLHDASGTYAQDQEGASFTAVQVAEPTPTPAPELPVNTTDESGDDEDVPPFEQEFEIADEPPDPEQPNTSIILNKRDCPATVDVTSMDVDYFTDTCHSPLNGVPFGLYPSLGQFDTETAGGGWIEWHDLWLGDVTIAETLPFGYGEPVVFCKIGGDFYDISNAERVEVVDAGIERDLNEGDETHICYWYNIPAPEQESGSFKVVKYWCDGPDYSTNACAVYTGSVQFLLSLAPNEGDGIIFDTVGDGVHQLDVIPGVWELIEVGDEWCAIESPNIDGDGYFVVAANEETVVNVFNCDGDPGDDAEDEMDLTTVTKLPDTGTGAALTQAPDATDVVRLALLGMVAFTAVVAVGLTSPVAGAFYRHLASSRH
ncbi:MAG: hypothetical protein ACRDJH_19815 [Thermomicrobiales bacterium]